MRDRIWYELAQAKHNLFYCNILISYRRNLLNVFNIIILIFSTAGIMGWTFWKEFPLISCFIVSGISLLKLVSPHIIPSEKQIEKLDEITDFYFEYYNKLENLWYEINNEKHSEDEYQKMFYKIKLTEKKINKLVNENIKKRNKKITKKSKEETDNYLIQTFNLQ